jgi:Bacterial PH domain
MAHVPVSPEILDSCPVPELARPHGNETNLMAIQANVFDGERIDGVYRGCDKGAQLLAVSNRRVMIVETDTCEGREALTSVPFGRITSVSFVASDDGSIAASTTVGIRVHSTRYELCCQTKEQAQEVHDLITWNLICA